MKKIIPFLFLVFSFAILFAQGNINFPQEKIDSIQKLLDANRQDDTIKVKQLNELARICFSDFQYERGLNATKQAHQLAEKIKYRKGEGMYFRTMAILYNYTIIKFYYDTKAKWLFTDINENEDIDYLELPSLNGNLIEKINTHLTSSLDFFEKVEDKENTAHILFIKSILSWQKNPIEALAYLDRAINLFKEINQNAPAVLVLTLKMYTLQSIEKIKEANDVDSEVSKLISEISGVKESALLSFYICQYHSFIGKKILTIEKELKIDEELEKVGEKKMRILVLEDLAVNFGFLSMSQKSVEYYKKAISLREDLKYYDDAIRIYFNLGFELVALKEFDEAKKYFLKAKDLSDKNRKEDRQAGTLRYLDAMGQIQMGQEKYQEALNIFNQADDNLYIDYYKANCYRKLGNLKESISYGERSYKAAINYTIDQRILLKISLLLSEVHDQLGQKTMAYEYLKKYRSILKNREEEDIANRSANFEIQKVIDKNQREKDLLEKEKLLKEKQNQNQRWWLITIAGVLFSTFILLFVSYRNNQNRQRANTLLQKQKEKVENTLTELKSTQAQLIQSEKMASLGELTAGIAHEIQNPLNFVNNFSEVSTELLNEMKDEIVAGNWQLATEIADDVKQNLEKINFHGKRADSIVKGMLQHSRTSSGMKEPTNINALADEYLRLAYHGLRAKDKSFNADFKTNFDENLPKINVIPQDIGRVILNLITNAFYAVTAPPPPEGGIKNTSTDYMPTVTIRTSSWNPPSGGRGASISVRDNGPGIPAHIVDKIFQPFFTTKPTGQGTGLGLSLAYDIVKAHGGELKVETKEGKGTEFIILLPVV